ncbi:hypothetical protein BZG36_05538 [Bifiguratus adelaidae]|uniref:Oxidoreductase DltE n=1 Tax=Bifiguratus adelaidae TaxID=1938954 RepID=A0A261XTT4_9FUNG|nr:hypothetical protein BZG36_05538 [Bifiguratus adelaidae]
MSTPKPVAPFQPQETVPAVYPALTTIFLTGATSGIGLALAQRMLKEGKTVITTARSAEKLKAAQELAPGLVGYMLDMTTGDKVVGSVVDQIIKDYPQLDAVICNAGIQKTLYFNDAANLPDPNSTWKLEIETNITSVLSLIQMLLPHFLAKDSPCAIMTVTSGLAFIPSADYPIYNATKAFIHSYSMTLRHQLRKTNVSVVEIIPPAVQSNLNPEHREAHPERASMYMPLDVYADDVLEKLRGTDGQSFDEITSGFSEAGCGYARAFIRQRFQMLNPSN